MAKKFEGYSYSFNVPYPGWNNVYNMNAKVETFNELERIDFLEQQIQEMTSYPDAEAIINKIKGNTNGSLDQ
jgi:hypothetical protein